MTWLFEQIAGYQYGQRNVGFVAATTKQINKNPPPGAKLGAGSHMACDGEAGHSLPLSDTAYGGLATPSFTFLGASHVTSATAGYASGGIDAGASFPFLLEPIHLSR
jgi:hypothetical protein